MEKKETLRRLAECGVIAVIRTQHEEQLQGIVGSLIEGGVIGIEVTMTTPNALAGIEKLAATFAGQAVLGVGTVLDEGTAVKAIKAGAEFVVSPVFVKEVVEVTRQLGKVSVPGAFTPAEILAAWGAGADVVKVFPATSLGPQYLKDLLAPMPFLKLTPTGGVDVKTAGAWIKAGAMMVGAGTSLVSNEMVAAGNWAGIASRAREFVNAVREARSAG